MISQICLDMDGVLTKFTEHTLELFGKNVVEMLSTWQRGAYEIFSHLGISENELWAEIDKHGEDYWVNMPAYDWHQQLLQFCRFRAPTIILTSPSRAAHSCSGKILWLQKHYGVTFRDYLLGPRKHFCARPGAVLIDDSDENCAKFRANGGIAIVFPQPWNTNHDIKDSMDYTLSTLKSLK